MSGVKIKPLVWERIQNYWIAITPIATYEVWKSVIDGRWKWRQHGHQECYLDSEVLAKAACQAEYERRVRECLE